MNTSDVMEWRRIFDEYQITYAIMNCARGLISTKGIYTIPRIILSWADWRLVFWDDIAMVFVKDIPEYKELIARCNCRIFPESLPYKNNPVSNIEEVEVFIKNQSRWQLIEKELLRVIEECPQHFRAALALGLLRDAQGNSQGAIEAYRIAERIIPNHPELLQLFARWNLIQGNYEKATEYINNAISNGLNKVGGLYNLAFIQYRAGRKDDALKTVNKLLKIQPEHQNGQKLYEQLTKNSN
jgi:tetratricopeptide (TPR) repeat protein